MQSSAAAHSSEFRIFETDEFKKALGRINMARALRRKIDSFVYPQLRKTPFFGPNIRKLKDYEPPTWRYRVGPFRLFYLIDLEENRVILLTIDDRKDAYR